MDNTNTQEQQYQWPSKTDCIHYRACRRIRKINAERQQVVIRCNDKCNSYVSINTLLSSYPQAVTLNDILTGETSKQTKRIEAKKQYYNELNTTRFAELKMQVFLRDGLKCKLCGSTRNLVPHHTTYINRGHEKPEDLITLCEKCHKQLEIQEMEENNHGN